MIFETPLIKVVLYIDVGIQQILSIWGQIHLVKDQVLKGLLQVGFPNKHSSNHASSADNRLETRTLECLCDASPAKQYKKNWNCRLQDICCKSPEKLLLHVRTFFIFNVTWNVNNSVENQIICR